MSYKDDVTQKYIHTLREGGITDEDVISLMLIAFDSGFKAGLLDSDDYFEDEVMQERLRIPPIN